MSRVLAQFLASLDQVRREHNEKQDAERREAERALDHLRNEGCNVYHYEGACEWQVRCDEPGCMKPVTCGTPTPNGYRSTCSQHRPDKYVERKRNTLG